MSLLTQRVVFHTSQRSLALESDPNTIYSLEQIAFILGATLDQDDDSSTHHLNFYLDTAEKSNKALSAIEKVWEKFKSISFFRIKICCRDQILTVEGDGDTFRSFSALVQSFNKCIENETITFSENEYDRFAAIHTAALAMGIIPYC